jgi:type III secretion protein U
LAGESEEKPLPASEKKLRDARKKGQVPKSKDFVSAAVTVLAIGLIGSRVSTMFDVFADLIDSTGNLLDQPLAVALPTLTSQIAATATNILAPLLVLLVATAMLASLLVTRGPVLSLTPIMPDLKKLSPGSGLKNMVSIRGLFEVLKGIAKLVVIVIIATHVIRGSLSALVELPSCGLECSAPLLRASLLSLVGQSIILFLVFGLADIGLQHWLFMRKQRMSLTEMKNERKNSDGNPLIKSAHKRHRREAAQTKAGMNQATCVVAGSQHAVALRYSAVDTKVPISVARAEAEDVPDFIQSARQHKLPIVHAPATARALFEKVQIGKTIPTELFQAVIDCMKQADAMQA